VEHIHDGRVHDGRVCSGSVAYTRRSCLVSVTSTYNFMKTLELTKFAVCASLVAPLQFTFLVLFLCGINSCFWSDELQNLRYD